MVKLTIIPLDWGVVRMPIRLSLEWRYLTQAPVIGCCGGEENYAVCDCKF